MRAVGINPRRDLKEFLANQSQKRLMKYGFWLLAPGVLFWFLALTRWLFSFDVLLDLFFTNRTIGYSSVVIGPIASGLIFGYANSRQHSRLAKIGIAASLTLLLFFALASSRNS